MNMRFALVCEYANVTADGKANIMGVLERIIAPNFPATKSLFLVISIDMEPQDQGLERAMKVQLVDPDGKTQADVNLNIQCPVHRPVLNSIAVFENLQFQNPGGHSFNIFFEGTLEKSVEIELIRHAGPSQQS